MDVQTASGSDTWKNPYPDPIQNKYPDPIKSTGSGSATLVLRHILF